MKQVDKFNSGVDFGILYGKDELLRSCVLMALRNAVGHSQRITRTELVLRVRSVWYLHGGQNVGSAPGDRRIRNTIRDLRRDGALILSTGGRKGGYWKAILPWLRFVSSARLSLRPGRRICSGPLPSWRLLPWLSSVGKLIYSRKVIDEY